MENFSSLDSGVPHSPESDSAASGHSIDLPLKSGDSDSSGDSGTREKSIDSPLSFAGSHRDSDSDQSMGRPITFAGSHRDSDSDSDRGISHSPDEPDTDDMDDDDTVNCDDTLNATTIHDETLMEDVDGVDETDSSKPVGGLCHHQEHPHKVDSVSDTARRPLGDIGCNSSKKRKQRSSDSGDEKRKRCRQGRRTPGKADKENAIILEGVVGRPT